MSLGCDLTTYVVYMYTYFGAARGAVRSRCVSPIAALSSFKGLQLATHAAPSRRAPPPPLRPAAAECRPVIMLARACAGPRRAAPAAGGGGGGRLRFLPAADPARRLAPLGFGLDCRSAARPGQRTFLQPAATGPRRSVRWNAPPPEAPDSPGGADAPTRTGESALPPCLPPAALGPPPVTLGSLLVSLKGTCPLSIPGPWRIDCVL